MALETLRNVTKISGVKIQRENEDNFDRNFILLKEKESIIAFKIQDGPIKEVGENGVQFTSLIVVAKLMLEELNKKFPCRENAMTITKLDEALMWQDKRTKDRELRNVEGLSIA